MARNEATIAAFELARVYGLDGAQRIAAERRDANAQGSVTFALHNEVCKALHAFATAGSMYRPIKD